VTEKNAIYFTDSTNSKVYRAKHHDGKFAIDLIRDKLLHVNQIQVLDKYLYYADSTGLHVLKTSKDKATKGYQTIA
jgi:hypothetical protein